MKKQLEHYWLAMNAAGIQAAAHAGKAWIAVGAAHEASDSIPALNWRQLVSVLAVAFLIAVLDWLGKNPLPVDDVPITAMLAKADEQLSKPTPISPAIQPETTNKQP